MQIFITCASFAFQHLPGQHGFDLKMSGNATGCMFGPGAYFAESSSKCDEYAKEVPVQKQIETNGANLGGNSNIFYSWGEGSLSHYLQGFIHSRWLFGISSINSRWWFETFFIFTPIPGEMIQFDLCIFFKWVEINHQQEIHSLVFVAGSLVETPWCFVDGTFGIHYKVRWCHPTKSSSFVINGFEIPQNGATFQEFDGIWKIYKGKYILNIVLKV